MAFGSTGKLLRVNLTSGDVQIEQLPESFYRLYPGGKAMAGYFLLKELSPGVEPLSPDNLLVIANGMLTGAPVSTATRFTVAARTRFLQSGTFWMRMLQGRRFPLMKPARWLKTSCRRRDISSQTLSSRILSQKSARPVKTIRLPGR